MIMVNNSQAIHSWLNLLSVASLLSFPAVYEYIHILCRSHNRPAEDFVSVVIKKRQMPS